MLVSSAGTRPRPGLDAFEAERFLRVQRAGALQPASCKPVSQAWSAACVQSTMMHGRHLSVSRVLCQSVSHRLVSGQSTSKPLIRSGCAGEGVLRQSGLGYVIVRPAQLLDEPGGYKALLFDQVSNMVALFLPAARECQPGSVDCLCATSGRHNLFNSSLTAAGLSAGKPHLSRHFCCGRG